MIVLGSMPDRDQSSTSPESRIASASATRSAVGRAVEVDRHGEGADLPLRHAAVGDALDEGGDLGGGQLLAGRACGG